jgi:homocysteine S-methyltransferase
MPKYRSQLPQLDGGLFLTDGGLETVLVFHEGLELPDFAAFPLLRTAGGVACLRRYVAGYVEIARRVGTGLILETPTWRASADWGRRLGYDPGDLAEVNRAAIRLIEDVRTDYETPATPMVLSGCLGPRGDGYVPGDVMSESEAEAYHREQVSTFAGSAADLVSALTLPYAEEAVGIARAARSAGIPVVISFTVETDGRLPSGQPLGAAVEQVDEATAGYPAYYMVNCAHPTHVESALGDDEAWLARLRGLRANASRKSHAELNESAELDMGSPDELGAQYASLKQRLPHLNVMGGCCGTDDRHVGHIAAACAPLFQVAD